MPNEIIFGANNIYKAIKDRMEKRLPFFQISYIISKYASDIDYGYYVAGSSCNSGKPNDFDIYPSHKQCFNFMDIEDKVKDYDSNIGDAHIVSKSKNTLTVNIDGYVLQFCNYVKDSLSSLIEGFDYAHVQIGVMVRIPTEPAFDGYGRIIHCAFTQEYIDAMVTGNTRYTGTEYPMASLFRMSKYKERGFFIGNSWKVAIMDCLKDILVRGFESYADFKDQFCAIDLAMLESGDESNSAWELYKAFYRRGLVCDKTKFKSLKEAESSLENGDDDNG